MGMFDDLVPGQPPAGGMFDDLVPAPQQTDPNAPPIPQPEMVMDPIGAGTRTRATLENLPGSAMKFGEDIAQPFISPIETGKALGNVALGGIQKLIPGEQSKEQYADAVGQFFNDRYGGLEEAKQTMTRDPVGFMADLATVLTAGGAAAAKVPGTAGQIGKAVGTVGRAVDPVRAVGRVAGPAARGLGRGAANVIGALGTHTGGQSLQTAARAGLRGGDAAADFTKAMRGGAEVGDVVSDAERALANMRVAKNTAYRSGMKQVAKSKKIVDFAPIDRALSKAVGIKRFKGEVINQRTAKAADEISEAVNKWKMLDPADFHTPEGLDALKQKVGDIAKGYQYGTPERLAADTAYKAIKNEIVRQAPEYAKVMKGYWEAIDTIKEIEKTLSLKPTATVDTKLRKLQSVLRNNANTNYGRRVALAEMLEEAGASTLMEKLSGQMLQDIAPRGLGRLQAGALGAGGLAVDPALLATLPLQSPRLMGEAALATGKAARQAQRIPGGTGLAAFQAGRTAERGQ